MASCVSRKCTNSFMNFASSKLSFALAMIFFFPGRKTKIEVKNRMENQNNVEITRLSTFRPKSLRKRQICENNIRKCFGNFFRQIADVI